MGALWAKGTRQTDAPGSVGSASQHQLLWPIFEVADPPPRGQGFAVECRGRPSGRGGYGPGQFFDRVSQDLWIAKTIEAERVSVCHEPSDAEPYVLCEKATAQPVPYSNLAP